MAKFTTLGLDSPVAKENKVQSSEKEDSGLLDYLSKNVVESAKKKIGSQISSTVEKIKGIPGQFVEHAKGVPQDITSVARGIAEIPRSIVAAPVRMAEGAASSLGGIAELGLGLGKEYINESIPSYGQVQEKYPKLTALFPTPDQAQAFAKKVTGGKIETDSELGKSIDETFRAIGAVGFNPVSAAAKFPNLMKSVTGVLAGKGAKFLAKGAGASHGTQVAADIAGMWLASNPGAIKGFKALEAPSWRKVKGALNETDVFPTKNISKTLDSIEKEITGSGSGLMDDAKKYALEQIDAIRSKMEGESILASELPAIKKSLNKFIGSKKTPYDAKPYLIEMKKPFSEGIKEYSKINKPFGAAHKTAEDVTKSVKRMSDFNKFLQKNVNIKDDITNNALKLLLVGGSAFSKGVKTTAIGITAGVALRDATRIAEMMYQSPTALKYFSRTLGAYAAGNLAETAKDLKSLDTWANKKIPNMPDIVEKGKFKAVGV